MRKTLLIVAGSVLTALGQLKQAQAEQQRAQADARDKLGAMLGSYGAALLNRGFAAAMATPTQPHVEH